MNPLQKPSWVHVPHGSLDRAAIMRVYRSYAEGAPWRPLLVLGVRMEAIPVFFKDLVLVGKYLVRHSKYNPANRRYWEIILEGGLRGYSVFVHERSELELFFTMTKLDPFRLDPRKGKNITDQQEGYPKAHAWALLVEHYYLQVRAAEEKKDCSPRELVVTNPHGLGEEDWEILVKQFGQQLSEQDLRHDPDGCRRACEWYHGHYFDQGLP